MLSLSFELGHCRMQKGRQRSLFSVVNFVRFLVPQQNLFPVVEKGLSNTFCQSFIA